MSVRLQGLVSPRSNASSGPPKHRPLAGTPTNTAGTGGGSGGEHGERADMREHAIPYTTAPTARGHSHSPDPSAFWTPRDGEAGL